MNDGSIGAIDDLEYTYSGNQLVRVSDDANGPTYVGAMHFQDNSDEAVEYTYDENGRLTQDLNKKISLIQYNAVSLPSKVAFSDLSYITYLYDASGSKLRTDYYIRPLTVVTPIASWDDAYSEAGNSEVVSEPETDVDADRDAAAMASASFASSAAPNATGIVVPIRLEHPYTEYCGNHVSENGLLTMTLIPGGYISYEGGSPTAPSFHFYLCDHEGNNRVVTDINGNIEQVNDYTPFGVLMKNDFSATSTQPYKYNGKELDRMHGLDLYDYGARLYEAPLGRWHTMDPLCEKYYSWSPYVYCANNPSNAVDPDGRKSLLIIWASSQQHYGHAAFAVQNYSSDHTPMNTYNVYGLFPYNSDSSTDAVKDKKVRGFFLISLNRTLDQIMRGDFLSGEDYKPDGILEIQSDYEHDENARNAMQEGVKLNQGYKGASRNCSTYAREGVRKATGDDSLSGEESILLENFVTPNQLYKETSQKDNVKPIVDAKDKVNYKIDCVSLIKK